MSDDHDLSLASATPLSGRGLRFVVVNELMQHPELSVAQLVQTLSDRGYVIAGRASKVISDSLRWEIRRGRVVRLGRGRYRYRRAPATTARRIRIFAERCDAWVLAVSLGQTPPPTPPDLRADYCSPFPLPGYPPWHYYGWLWTT
jgi:hypothetical protein